MDVIDTEREKYLHVIGLNKFSYARPILGRIQRLSRVRKGNP
jgi:hypothetical protein